MQINIKQIMHTIQSAQDINGKCSDEEYKNIVSIFLIYNILIFPLDFVYERSSSIIIFVVVPLIFVGFEVVFILTSIRRLNYLDYKKWLIASYMVFRGIYLYSLKSYGSIISADVIISFFANITFIFYLLLPDGIKSIYQYLEDLKNNSQAKKLETDVNEFHKIVEGNESNLLAHMIISIVCIIYFIFIPSETKKNINSVMWSSFDKIIFEINKLDDRIVGGKNSIPQSSNLESSNIERVDGEMTSTDQGANLMDSKEKENTTNSE